MRVITECSASKAKNIKTNSPRCSSADAIHGEPLSNHAGNSPLCAIFSSGTGSGWGCCGRDVARVIKTAPFSSAASPLIREVKQPRAANIRHPPMAYLSHWHHCDLWSKLGTAPALTPLSYAIRVPKLKHYRPISLKSTFFCDIFQVLNIAL